MAPAQPFPKVASIPQGEAALPLLLGKRRATGRAWLLALVWMAVGVLLGFVQSTVSLSRWGIWVGIICFVGSIVCGVVAVAMVRRLIFDWAVDRFGVVAGVIVFCVVLVVPVAVYGIWTDAVTAKLNVWMSSTPWVALPTIGVAFMCGVAAIMVAIAGIGEMIGQAIDRAHD